MTTPIATINGLSFSRLRISGSVVGRLSRHIAAERRVLRAAFAAAQAYDSAPTNAARRDALVRFQASLSSTSAAI